MAAAAVRLAGQLFEDLGKIRVLFVGAGEMIELAATHFAARNPKGIAIANRTLERGEKLATRFGGEVMRLADLPARLHEFDAVVSCTASTLPIIGLGAVERALKARKHRPMFMVDLAVPRDIEPEVKALEDVYLYTVDDLAQRGADRPGQPAGRGGAGRGHHRRRRAELPALDGPARQRAADPAAQRAGRRVARRWSWRAPARCWPRARTSTRCWRPCRKGLTQKMLHGAMAELHAGDAEPRASAPAPAIQHFFLRKER